MEIRKVQLTGGSSYVITLPKEWIKSVNIKKNDPVGIFIQSDGSLLISQKMNRDPTHRLKEFKVSNITKQTYLLRKLIGAYIAGYTSIKITSDHRIPSVIRGAVRDFTQETIGQEVVEETEKSVIIKDIFNPTELPLDRTIKRMYIIVKGMHEDVIVSIQRNDKNLAEDVLLRDNEIDRLHWLVARQHNIILQNVSFAEKMGITIQMATTSFLISKIIERIGDHAIRIAKNAILLSEKKINETIVEKLEYASNLALDIFNNSIASFTRGDVELANQTIESVEKLEKKCKEINNIALKQKGDFLISLGYVVESIRRIGEYSSDISENTINYLIGMEK